MDDFDPGTLEDEILECNQPARTSMVTSTTPRWLNRLSHFHRKLNLPHRAKTMAAMALFLAITVIEGPRVCRLYGQVYGPSQVDLKERFPTIHWLDESGDSILERPIVYRALYQAIHWRNPVMARTPILEIAVRKQPEPSGYQWTVVRDEIAQQRQTQANMRQLSRKEMHALQNMVSGYKNLRFILGAKLFLMWGGQGRFIVLCIGLCFGVYGLWVRRMIHKVQSIQADAFIRDRAAGYNILERVAQDPHAADNLMLFNQQRRLRIHDQGTAETWEQEAFDWIEHNLDLDTGQTRRTKRDEALREKRKKRHE